MISFKNILSVITVVGIFALHPSLNKGENIITHLQYLIYGNSIDLSYSSSISKNKINVKWKCENYSLGCVELIIIQNGKKIHKIPFEKGSQKLIVYYDGKIVGTIHQNKSIKNQAHKYYINLASKLNLLTFRGAISGPSSSSVSQTTNTNTISAGLPGVYF